MDINIDDENLAICKVLEQIHHKTNKMSIRAFKSLVCVMIEEYCEEHGLDAESQSDVQSALFGK